MFGMWQELKLTPRLGSSSVSCVRADEHSILGLYSRLFYKLVYLVGTSVSVTAEGTLVELYNAFRQLGAAGTPIVPSTYRR